MGGPRGKIGWCGSPGAANPPKPSPVLPAPDATAPPAALDRFLPTFAALPNPVGLLPLDGSDFSSCKSAVAFFDHAMAGSPNLRADHAPFRTVVRPGASGWRCAEERGAWALALSNVYSRAGPRLAVAAAARADVLAHRTLAQTRMPGSRD